MTAKSSGSKIDVQLENWNNFCQYHLGNWHGVWTRYSPTGEAIESFKCVRQFHVSEDGNRINHKNFFTYFDGREPKIDCYTYNKPDGRAMFLDNSFSWGKQIIQVNSTFGFEIGFRLKNSGATAAVLYDDSGNLQRITISLERLGEFAKEELLPSKNEPRDTWQGIIRSMMPDLTTSAPKATTWKQLENISHSYKILHFSNSISVSCPTKICSGQEILFALDWYPNSSFLQRGIRHFDRDGFKYFSLETFSVNP
ncbi:MAG: DUF3598 family protein, partial [Chroococcidiopsidaceae cyanobacterium CP_BM_RX_35]|nr:DUF3598 family protein [Chroococcidiopsidaceae cyanobacterium CP_BM_RX_35]